MKQTRLVCEGVKDKLPFTLAERIAKKLRYRGLKGVVEVYRCPECHGFHVGGVQGCFKSEAVQMSARVREQRRSRRIQLGRLDG